MIDEQVQIEQTGPQEGEPAEQPAEGQEAASEEVGKPTKQSKPYLCQPREKGNKKTIRRRAIANVKRVYKMPTSKNTTQEEKIALVNAFTNTGDNPEVAKALIGLTKKQAKFAMIIAQNPTISTTQAYKQAGYTGNTNTCAVGGFTLLRNKKLVNAVTKLRNITKTEYRLTIESVLHDLRSVVEDARKNNDRSNLLRALELQGKYLAMWTERSLTEDVNESKRLTERQQEEARRIAQIRLTKTA